MFLETLIAANCIVNKVGCGESTSAYYQQSVELHDLKDKIENYGKYIVQDQDWLIYAATPMYAIAAKQSARIMINHNLMMNVDLNKSTLGLQWNY